MHREEIHAKLQQSGLKITPQRAGILRAVYKLQNHPTAQQIINFVHESAPNVATGTIYKTLDTLVEKGVIGKVQNTEEATRYDSRMEQHHHLYGEGDNRIEDYVNEELDHLLENFFLQNNIPGYEINSINVNINGRFTRE